MKIKKILMCLIILSFLACILGCPPRPRFPRPRRPLAANQLILIQPVESAPINAPAETAAWM